MAWGHGVVQIVAGAQVTATAACPYEGCLPTRTTGTATVQAGRATVKGTVKAVDSLNLTVHRGDKT